MFKKFICAALVLFSVFAVSEDSFAKGGRGGSFGGGRSSGGFSGGRSSAPSRSVAPSPSRSFGGSRSTPKVTPAPSSNVSNPAARSAPKPTQVQNKAFAAAKTKGKAFTSKEQAVTDFKAKNSQLTSKYATEPKTRPEHIPATTSIGGQTYNINYNSQFGGYGYTNALGLWIAYDMMSDAVMMNHMMNRQGYYVGSPTVAAPAVAPVPVVYSHGPGYYIGWFFVVLLFAGGAIFFFYPLIRGY